MKAEKLFVMIPTKIHFFQESDAEKRLQIEKTITCCLLKECHEVRDL